MINSGSWDTFIPLLGCLALSLLGLVRVPRAVGLLRVDLGTLSFFFDGIFSK